MEKVVAGADGDEDGDRYHPSGKERNRQIQSDGEGSPLNVIPGFGE